MGRFIKPTSKRRKAQKQNSTWRSLAPAEQLAELDKRLGEGQGAKKQRSKLERRKHVLETVAKAHVCDEGCIHQS